MEVSRKAGSIEDRAQFYGSFTREFSEIDELLADVRIHPVATAQANMMQQAMFNVGTGNEIAARVADDARADGGRRMVWLDPRYVTIKRRLRGMKMHLSVPVESYLGVMIACEERPEGDLYRISLAHRDPELCVTLKETGDRPRILDAWRNWAAFFGVPALVECDDDESEARAHCRARQALARMTKIAHNRVSEPLSKSGESESVPALAPSSATAACAFPRRLSASAKRSLRRRLRRKTANLARRQTVFRGEREIICYE